MSPAELTLLCQQLMGETSAQYYGVIAETIEANGGTNDAYQVTEFVDGKITYDILPKSRNRKFAKELMCK